MECDLRGAADRGELYARYQPIVAASDGAVVGVEALLRWLHPTQGLVPPTMLIPLAERENLMVEIGGWVLEQALLVGRSWQGLRQNGGFEISVNVSPHQLNTAGFVGAVEKALKASLLEPRLLTLEVDGASVDDVSAGTLTDLKSLGVKLALDDFGAGYSSLSDIARFPVDIIKVDRSFVTGLGEGARSCTIVRSVIELAHGLGMTTVAKGVETVSQLRELARSGCDNYQGFYFAPPMSVAKLSELSDGRVVPSFRSLLSPPTESS